MKQILRNKLRPDDSLYPNRNDRIVSENGLYEFVLQGDGNAVLYAGQQSLFATGTMGKTPGSLIYQTDGNVVLYDSQGHAVWATGTLPQGQGGYLIMQDDGNLVLYDSHNKAVWASNTVQEIIAVEGPLRDFVYDLDNAQIGPPLTVDSFPQNLCNESNTDQEQQVEMGFTYTETKTFSAAFGITIGASVEAEVGIPLVTNGKVTVSAELSTTLTWGEESSVSISKTTTTTAKIPARSKMRILPYVTQSPVTVPFVCTAHYTLRDLGTKKVIKAELPYHGTYAGRHDFSSQVNFYAPVNMKPDEGCSSVR